MGTRRRKRAIRKTRKIKGGVWTPNHNKSVRRRHNLLRYTTNSKQKTDKALEAVRNYLEALEETDFDNIITQEDVLNIIRPDKTRQAGTYIKYIQYVKRSWSGLIDSKLRIIMAQKEQINKKHHNSNQAVIEANRAAILAQKAAHIAAIGRLSNESHAHIKTQLDAWNTHEKEVNEKQALSMSQIKSKSIRLEYELKEKILRQIIHKVTQLDQIIPEYERYQSRNPIVSNELFIRIVEQARGSILTKIPELKNVSYNPDHVIPDVREDLYDVLRELLEKYIDDQQIPGMVFSPLDSLMVALESYKLKIEQMDLVNTHFIILREMSKAIRVDLAKTKSPLLDPAIYQLFLKQIKDTELKIKIEQDKIRKRNGQANAMPVRLSSNPSVRSQPQASDGIAQQMRQREQFERMQAQERNPAGFLRK